MRGHDDTDAVRGQVGDEARDDVAAGCIQAVEGLVHHDQLGARNEGACDEDTLALSATERPEAVGGPVGEVHALEGGAHPRAHVGVDAPAPASLGDEPHGDDLGGAHGEREVQVGTLRHEADAGCVHLDGPGEDLAAANNTSHECGLTAAIGADKGEGLAPEHVESQAGQRRGIPIPQRRVLKGDEPCHHWPFRGSGRSGTVPPHACVTARTLWMIEPT